jgi:NAD-dependent SIR2 family protein deacetylase
MNKEKKAVFVVGSGFSYNAGIPTQDTLLKSLNNYYQSPKCISPALGDWSSFVKFFKRTIGNNLDTYLIEDIFTTFDKCILDDESFKGYSSRVLQRSYIHLLNSLRLYLIELVNDSILKNKTAYKDYSELALALLNKRKYYAKKDKLSIISLNWDSYFERVIVNKMINYRKYKLDIDYCTYDNSFDNSGKSKPSVTKKAAGKLNLKYLKPHGSINWGYCPNCGRLFISYGKKIESHFECIRFCNKKYGTVNLSPVMITPTFIKDISNKHLKDIWSNIGIELSEATELIFIGYCLRPEDYYFRYMLSKYVDPGTNLHIYGYSDKISTTDRNKDKTDLENKFSRFFQRCNIVTTNVDGWEKSITEIINILP